MMIRRFITVTGIVQGVGFRPFVFQHATRLKLAGWVCNSASGVKIDIQGSPDSVTQFLSVLQNQPPPLARIDAIKIDAIKIDEINLVEQDEIPHVSSTDQLLNSNPSLTDKSPNFEIRQSNESGEVDIDVSPDKTTCAACRDDILNPQSRFYHYPFTNCTHCGPRYSIIKKLPYDRKYTSMSDFVLCPTCDFEYQNPMDRRYHAQPISCPDCGPQLSYFVAENECIAQKQHALIEAVKAIQQGGVLAIKGLGGFHLVCDASQSQAVAKLRQLKHRQRKPFAIMVADTASAEQLVTGNKLEWQTLTSAEAPIILMKKQQGPVPIADNLVYDNPYLGVMLPYTPLHILLFDLLKKSVQSQTSCTALVMTSANRSGVPLAIDSQQVWSQFSQHQFSQYQFTQQIDGVLDHNRPIVQACDDSLVQVVAGKLRILRLARGYAPLSFALQQPVATTLAVGAQQKSTFALADKHHWMLSPYIGELDDIDTQMRFKQTVDWFQQLYQCDQPQWLRDLHPDYFSSGYVQEKAAEKPQTMPQSIQHHYAHILSVMAEHQLTHQLLGIALDGTGFGNAHSIWGGEVLLADVEQYQRVGHIRPFRLIGRHQAIQEPARILYALLLEAYTPEAIQAMQLPAFRSWSAFQFSNLYQLWNNPTHSPVCTSTGRLFDAWAVLLELLTTLDYEGESGLLIEARAHQVKGYREELNTVNLDLIWQQQGGMWQLDWLPALQKTITLLASSESTMEKQTHLVCDAFCCAWAKAVLSMTHHYPNYDVALSGGVCQNRVFMEYIQQLALDYLGDNTLYLNENIPANDAGIAAGQLWHVIASPSK